MRSEDLGKLLLRGSLGALMLLHGIGKIRHGVDGIATNLTAHGMPHALAYGVYLGEVVAPVLLCLGWMTRPAALVVAFNMAMAVWLVHTGDVGHVGKAGGWALELQALYLVGALSVALLGSGAYSISRGSGRFD